MNILGISALYHDSAAAIVCNDKIVAAAQEERFTRKKHDSSFPANAVDFCIKLANNIIQELYTPFVTYEGEKIIHKGNFWKFN